MMNDNTTEFMKGAILGYCQSHKPEEVAELFDNVFLTLDIEKAASISAAISARYLCLAMKRDDIEEFISRRENYNE